MVTSVACPCCSRELYATELIQGPYFGKVRGPELQQDSTGAFMVCPHCESRVDFMGTGQIQLAPIQHCKKPVG